MATYDPVADVIQEEGLDTAPRAQPVFQPNTPAYDPIQDVIDEEKPVFQPLHPDAQPDGDRPVFQSHHDPVDAIELPAQTTPGETHIELTRPGRPFAQTPLPLGTAPAEVDQFPGVQPEPGLQTVVPRAYTPQLLAARQQAEQFGGQFGQRPLPMPAVGAAAQQAQQFAAGTVPAPTLPPVNAGDVAQQFWNQLTGHFQETATILNQAQGPRPDQLHLQQFLDQGLPGETPEGKQLFLQQLQAMPREQRAQIIEAYIPYATAGGPPSTDPQSVMSAIDRLNDPALQAQWKAQQDQAVADAQKKIAGDPRLAGTPLGNAISDIASIPDLAVTAAVPPLFAAQLQTQIRAQLAQAHPDWSDDKLDDMAARSTIAQVLPQEIGGRLLGAGVGPMIGGIRSSLGRAAAQVGVGAATQAGLAATGQIASNIAIGEPVTQGVGQAAISGATMGGVAGAVHGVGELARPEPEAAPAPKPEPTTGPSGARIRGPTEATLEAGQAAAAVAPENVPQGALPPPPERGTILGAEGQVQPVPEPARAGAEVLPPVQGEVYEGVAQGAGAEPQGAVSEARPGIPVQQVAQEPITRQAITQRAFEISQERQRTGAEGDALSDWNQAQQELTQIPVEAPPEVQPAPLPAQPERPLPTPVARIPEVLRPTTEDEPWVSAIANRYTQARSAAGKIGEIAPGQGYSRMDLRNRGLAMGPEEATQHISDLMQGRGDSKLQAAAVTAEEARLSQRSSMLSKMAEMNPDNAQAQTDAENAFKDLTDFHNGPVAALKNNWHATGMTMQGEVPVDLGSYNGLREQWLKDIGTAPPASAEPVLRKAATRVRNVENGEKAIRNDLGQQVDRAPARVSDPDAIANNIMERLKNMPCVMR